MKQGKIYNRIILGILLLVVVCYMGFAVFSAIREPLTTVQAVEYEAGTGCRCTGYVVRSETVLRSSSQITVPARSEGEKVGVGQVVATGYSSSDAQNRQAEIDAIRTQLQQLEAVCEYQESPMDTGLDARFLSELSQFSQAVQRRDTSTISGLSTELKGLVLCLSAGVEDLSTIRSRINDLNTQLQQLQAASGTGTVQITATSSGYFSGTVDGYEALLTPERLSSLSAAELLALTPADIPSGACGRIIDEPVWYFATVVSAEYLQDIRTGDSVSVQFSQGSLSDLTMTVSRIGDNEDGQQLLVLRSTEFIQDVTLLRQQSAEIVFRSYSGLRVPKEAIRVSASGQRGVYILESATARWKPVTILYDTGESYVVELDKSSVDNLWPGDEIIVNAKNLSDGKVVIKS